MAEENCFQEPFKTIQAVQVSKFIWQQVPDCQAGVYWVGSEKAENVERRKLQKNVESCLVYKNLC